LIVEYSLRNANKPIGVAQYELAKELPEQFKNKLPTIDDLKHKLIDNE